MWSKPPLYLPTSEVQGECRAELARALLNRSLHSQFYIAKLQKIIETTKDKGEKYKNKCRIIWKLLKFFLSLQRQSISLGYPVSFRVGARLDRHYSIYKQRVTSGGSFVI
jgi:hypothetical protein